MFRCLEIRVKKFAQVAFLLAALLLWLAMSQICPTASAVPDERIDQIFAGLKSTRAPGAAVLVVKNRRIVFERGYGVMDLRSLGKTVRTRISVLPRARNSSLLWRSCCWCVMASCITKTGSPTSSMIFRKSNTVRSLLNHTSGLEDYEDLMAKPAAGTPAENIPQIRDSGVLELLKQQKHKISSRHKMGLQQKPNFNGACMTPRGTRCWPW